MDERFGNGKPFNYLVTDMMWTAQRLGRWLIESLKLKKLALPLVGLYRAMEFDSAPISTMPNQPQCSGHCAHQLLRRFGRPRTHVHFEHTAYVYSLQWDFRIA